MNNKLYHVRRDYKRDALDESQAAENPIVQFDKWWKEAEKENVPEINAMTLSTVDAFSQPHSRIVLLKRYSEKGFTFFTSYESAKAAQLEQCSKACLLFFWIPLERQIRIEGSVCKASAEENEAYFNSRPFESQVSAFVSKQSSPIDKRKTLEEAYDAAYNRYKDQRKVPYALTSWGGFSLSPVRIEFWQGRASRLHDRIEYIKNKEGEDWARRRLSP